MTTPPVETWDGQPTAFWRELWGVPRLEVYERVGSTNDRGRALAEEGWGPYTVVLAEAQTEGRGRNGAAWVSAPGCGLWMSVVLPASPAAHLPLLVGLAVVEGLERVAPGLRPRIEWPNDVTLSDRKVAGILCEGAGKYVVAGVGLNTSDPPGGFQGEVAQRAVSLQGAWGKPVERSALAGAVLAALRGRLAHAGPALTPEERRALSERDALEGRRVRTAQHGEGLAAGIAEDGALILERDGGTRVHVRAGQVRPLR